MGGDGKHDLSGDKEVGKGTDIDPSKCPPGADDDDEDDDGEDDE
ncbi:MAG: hypothetical protein ACRDRI_03840 [Pseudonocardiaceae bacterium]